MGSFSYHSGELSSWQEDFRAKLLASLNLTSFTAPLDALHYTSVPVHRKDLPATVRAWKVSFPASDGIPISAYLLIPHISRKEGDKLPTLLYYHGHHATKDDVIFNPENYNNQVGLRAAEAGYVVLVPDTRGFGESADGPHDLKDKNRSWGEEPFMKKGVLDALSAQFFLQKADLSDLGLPPGFIDADRNIIGGTSLGGLIALVTGALDSQFEAVVSDGLFVGFEALFSKHHRYCQHLPPLKGKANIFDLALLVAPRRLFIGMGEEDKFFNGYSKSAMAHLVDAARRADLSVCLGRTHDVSLNLFSGLGRYEPAFECPLVLEVKRHAKHEFVSDPLGWY